MFRQFCSVKLKSSKLMVCLSLITIFILIVSTVTIVSLTAKTPIIILALAQSRSGQMDFKLQPRNSFLYLNNSKIRELTKVESMGRIHFSVKINEQYGQAWFMDFDRENAQRLGHYGYDIPENQVFLHSSYQVQPGSIVRVKIYTQDFKNIFDYLKLVNPLNFTTSQLETLQSAVSNMASLEAPFQVAGVFNTSMGKFAEGDTPGYAYFNIKSALNYLVKQTLERSYTNNKQLILKAFGVLNFEQFSDIVVCNMPNRTQIYGNADYDVIAQQVNRFASNILENIGIYSVESGMPILAIMGTMNLFGMFIGVVLNLIVFSLFSLSVLMMYNMMMIGVETKNFDFGILRTVGMNRYSLVMAVLIDSVKYVVVANLLAFPASFKVLGWTSGIFTQFFGFEYVLQPTFGAILGATLIGFLVPIVASFIPIKVALGEKIIQAINPIRSKTVAIKHQTYVEGRQFPLAWFLFGVVSFLLGLGIVYLLPKALLDRNVGLLLTVFFTLLVGLLLGLVIMSYSFHYLLERAVAYLTLFWISATDLSLVIKNLSSHRVKNRRAALLYSLSVAFIVFTSVAISIQIQTIYNELLKEHSCYVDIGNNNDNGLNRQFYDELLSKPNYQQYILDYSFKTYSLHDYFKNRKMRIGIQQSDRARQFFLSDDIVGVSPNLLKTVYFQNFDVPSTLSKQGLDPFEYLYTKDGRQTAVVSQYLAQKLNINLDSEDSRQIIVSLAGQSTLKRYHMNVSSVMAKSAGLPFSSFFFLPSRIAVNVEVWAELAGVRRLSRIPYEKVMILLKNPSDSVIVANMLRRDISNNAKPDSVWEYSQLANTIKKIQKLLSNIFLILLFVVLLISFFSLLTTATTNILNQSKEIAVLLSLGLSKRRICLIFIYEAFVLVLTACIIGMFVGYSLAIIMGMQRQLFGDFTVKTEVPGFWLIVVSALISSVASTLGTIRNVVSHRVADILKMT